MANMTETQISELRESMEAEWKGLKRRSKADLVSIWRRGRRVASSKGMTKLDLMNDIMHDRHGRRRVKIWIGE